eukprot:1141684-Pelagomonas_calceolata.AAC.1
MYLKSLRADRQHTDALHCLISLLSLRDTIVSGGIVECSSLVMSYGMAQEVATCNLDKFVLLKLFLSQTSIQQRILQLKAMTAEAKPHSAASPALPRWSA